MYQFKMIALIIVSLFFLAVGIDLLISSYGYDNPFTFIMLFFASNLMILISAALCLGFAIRLKRSFASPPTGESPPVDEK